MAGGPPACDPVAVKRPRRLLSALLVVAAVATVPAAMPDAQATESKRYPGLPEIFDRDYNSSQQEVIASSVGLGEGTRAKQTFRIPATWFRGVSASRGSGATDNSCTLNPPFSGMTPLDNFVWALSPAGAPQPLGYFPPVTVRTVAFGSIPVTATLLEGAEADAAYQWMVELTSVYSAYKGRTDRDIRVFRLTPAG